MLGPFRDPIDSLKFWLLLFGIGLCSYTVEKKIDDVIFNEIFFWVRMLLIVVPSVFILVWLIRIMPLIFTEYFKKKKN